MKKIILIIAVVVMWVCCSVAVSGTKITAEAYYYNYGISYDFLTDGTIEITEYNSSSTYVDVPSEIDGVPVTSIGNLAFDGCSNLTQVSLPEGIKRIGSSAFRNCSGLTYLRLPETVEVIESEAYAYCWNITTVLIPESVTSIGVNAFSGCTHLEKITINNPECTIYDSQSTLSYTAKIYGYTDSTAYDYAKKYSRSFVSIGTYTPSATTSPATTTTTTAATTVVTTTAPIETTRTTITTTATEGYLAVSSTVEAKPLEPNFFFSVDDREFNASTLFESLILISYDKNGNEIETKDIINDVSFGGLTPESLFDSAENNTSEYDGVYRGYISPTYQGVEIDEKSLVYIGVKGDTNLDGRTELADVSNVLNYYSCSAVFMEPSLTGRPGSDYETLAYFLADVDTESLCGKNTDVGHLNLSDAKSIGKYYFMFGACLDPQWPEIIPSLIDVPGSLWAYKAGR